MFRISPRKVFIKTKIAVSMEYNNYTSSTGLRWKFHLIKSLILGYCPKTLDMYLLMRPVNVRNFIRTSSIYRKIKVPISKTDSLDIFHIDGQKKIHYVVINLDECNFVSCSFAISSVVQLIKVKKLAQQTQRKNIKK